MNKKRVVSLLLACTLAGSLLSGCANDTQAHAADNTESIVETVKPIVVDEDTNKVDSYKKIPEVKVFEPGEHVFMIRYDFNCNPDFLNSVSIGVPDGYEILDVENYISCNWDVGGNRAQTKGADVWYINNETVEVTPVYNDSFGSYDYSQPGKVIEIEKEEDFSLNK